MTITTECKCCGQEFSWEKPALGRMRLYCSRVCRDGRNNSKVIHSCCKVCGGDLPERKQTDRPGRRAHFCSLKCRAAWSTNYRKPRIGKVHHRECRVCMKQFETKISQHHTCSSVCQKKWKVLVARNNRNTPLGVANCEHCGHMFDVTINKRRFCSHSCRGANTAPKTAGEKLQLKKWKAISERRRKCSSCGHAYLESLKHPHRTMCRGCRHVAIERNRRRTCEDCGVVYERQKYQSGKRCSACSEERKREVMRECRNRRKHRMRAKQKGGDLFVSRDIFKRDLWRCYLCGVKVKVYATKRNMPDEATIDHVVPVSKGGEHSLSNCRCACRECNTAKGARLPERQGAVSFWDR